jgi:creatinine amidohydrolase
VTALRWDALTREDLGVLLPDAVVVLALGATEQHGPHLVTAVDAALVEAVAARGAAQARRPEHVLLAPTLAFGSSHHHLPFGGTLSLSPATLQAVLRDLVASAVSSGARRLLILNGHGGNQATCAQVAADAARERGVVVGTAIYTDLAVPATGWAAYPGHAGAFETSMMLAVRPEGVHEDRVRPSPGRVPRSPEGLRLETPDLWQEIDGFTDDPRGATESAGAAELEVLAAGVARAIEAIADQEVVAR